MEIKRTYKSDAVFFTLWKNLQSAGKIPVLFCSIVTILCVGFLGKSVLADQSTGSTNALVHDKSIIHLDQNWNHSERKEYQSLSDGGALIMYSWLISLEAADSTRPVLSDSTLGLLSNEYTDDAGLPVGFVKQTIGEMAGSNCAACHQQEIHYKGKRIRIDGGASIGLNLRDVLRVIVTALRATVQDEDKFRRFAAKVNINSSDRTISAVELKQQVVDFLTKLEMQQNPVANTDSHYGYGRTDAIGAGINRTAALISNSNYVAANAPVSIPALWDTSKWLWVEYNSAFMQPMARNVISALARGVYVDYEKITDQGFKSTLEIENLYRQQQLVDKLSPPPYPQHLFGAVDLKRAERGKAIYSDRCAGCHNVTPIEETVKSSLIAEIGEPGYELSEELSQKIRERLDQLVETNLVSVADVGTDPSQARNTALVSIKMNGKGGVLEGSVPVTKFMEIVTQKTMDFVYQNMSQSEIIKRNGYLPNRFRACPEGTGWQCLSAVDIQDKEFSVTVAELSNEELARLDSTLYYRASPLDGIWATAPYLHNGSIPNMYQLLLPQEQRDELLLATNNSATPIFFVGNPEFDPVDLGFEWRSDEGLMALPARFDTSVKGNSNAGHSGPRYGTDLTDTERYDLIEYLKTHKSNLY